MKPRNLVIAFVLIQLFIASAGAATDSLDEANKAIRQVGAALAVLMFSIHGLRWVMSDSVADRAEAKKGMIYVIVGLLFLKLAFDVVCGVYGAGLSNFDVSCSVPSGELKCVCQEITTTTSTTTIP